ncbi:hypothetical protein HS961_12665 [Comamonas piscis]|uniref:Uncharacterized protein n=1 Tax=Comamonas piscis TaxID=1562974 RepID=A0A7G5EHY6_9BURK|nr:hypothetical protein [Comamonas piscis]QMV73611.1 hypothetical protein HS961_12665 [Comamonas piscis]WSO32033.1 hypothetical protein VUJ63_12700 [Comamonas piscis]
MQLSIDEIGYSKDQLEKLELYRQAMQLPSIEAAIEQLNRRQLDSMVAAMTGKRPGPQLAINNTTALAGSADDNSNKPT